MSMKQIGRIVVVWHRSLKAIIVTQLKFILAHEIKTHAKAHKYILRSDIIFNFILISFLLLLFCYYQKII